MKDQKAAKTALKRKTAITDKQERVVKWLRLHNRTLTFVGALIVFGTFVVKDALREQLKDLVDSIDKAESVYAMRQDMREMDHQLMLVTMLELRKPPQAQEVGESRLRVSTATLRWNIEVLRTEDISLSNTEKLLSALPARLTKGVRNGLLPRVKDARKQVDELLHKAQGVSPQTADGLTAYEALTKDIEAKVTEFWQDDQVLSMVVLDMAHETKVTNQQRYEVATWLSYLLYAFGWGLGLAGRLVGVEGIGSE